MLDKKKKGLSVGSDLKIVSVRMAGISVLGREPVLLFTVRQVEEVLLEIEVQPLPFAGTWLLGLYAWRQQVLPVVDIARLYGIQAGSTGGNERYLYLVVRTVVPEKKEKEMLRCIVKVSGRIAAGNVLGQCTPVAAYQAGINASLVRGIFEHKDGLMIVPDLVPVLCPDTVREPAV